MHVLQNGIPKSGNLWLYRILTQLLEANDIPEKSYIKNHPVYPGLQQMDFDVADMQSIDTLEIEANRCFAVVRQTFRDAIVDLDSYIESTRLVWTHASWSPNMSPQLYPRFDKIVYLIRDPRDALHSMSHFQFTPYKKRYYPIGEKTPEIWLKKNFSWWLKRWETHVVDHLSQKNELKLYPIFYERLIAQPKSELRKLDKYLGFSTLETELDSIVEQTRASNMRAKAPHHVRKANAGSWKENITASTADEIWDLVGDTLLKLGYTKTGTERRLPNADADFSSQ